MYPSEKVRLAYSAMAFAVIICVSVLPLQVRAIDNLEAGKQAFEQDCGVCHSVVPGKIKVGPPLAGVVGRVAGTIAAYSYSDAMKNSNVVWTPENLEAYIAAPTKMIPKVKMTFPGETDAVVRRAVVEFLKSLSPPAMNAASQ